MVDISHPRYTYKKRGVFYFSKSVPTDLRHHYLKSRIIQSLRAKSLSRVKGHDKRTTYFTHGKRSVDHLIKCLGCRSLDQYSSADAATFKAPALLRTMRLRIFTHLVPTPAPISQV